jgi:glycosyltransferase involved in cell wall biosynthesis
LKKILFITPYPNGSAGSQRFRFEQFLNEFDPDRIRYRQIPFVDNATYKIMYNHGDSFKKAIGLLKGIFRRLYCLIIAPQYDIIFVHREAAPIGPPIIEWFLSKVLHKKYIYDFDDSIWLHDISESNKGIVQKLKSSPNKIAKIIQNAGHIFAGNQYLADYSLQYNQNVSVIPTIVDTNHHQKNYSIKKKYPNKICIGWTGTHTTLRHFEELVPILNKVYEKHKTKIYFKLIINQEVRFPELDLQSTIWDKATEIDQLSELDIGIMPLPNDKWASGKCGFKAIQYMALNIPCVASNVGVNSKIVRDGENGILVNVLDDFEAALDFLIENPILLNQYSNKSRQMILDNYSKKAIKDKFMTLLLS